MTAKLGPVSAFFEAELRERIQERGVVVLLDADGHYTEMVDRLMGAAGSLPYAVRGFRGSFLELLLSLDGVADGAEVPRLLLHLPGFTEEDVHKTPLMELYKAGVRFRRKLETLVTAAAAGRVKAVDIEAFLSRGRLDLSAADGWLSAQLGEGSLDGLTAELRAMRPTVLLDDLLKGGFFTRLRPDQGGARWEKQEAQDAVWHQLAVWTGLPRSWRDAVLPVREADQREEDIAFTVASWALVVEYVSDLKRAPVQERLVGIPSLPAAVMNNCRALAAHLRTLHTATYRQTADATEALLGDEVEMARAADLGSIDTFRFEDDKVLEAALEALGQDAWSVAAEWADARLGGGSFWLEVDPLRTSAWLLVQSGAALGQAIADAGAKLGALSLAEAAARYAEAGAAVDRAHRHLEQRRTVLLEPVVPHFALLRTRLDALRQQWVAWADDWNRDFSRVCVRQGFLPAADLQQRTLFEEVVRPMAQKPGTTALFLVDALRFEMAAELFEAIDPTPATTVHLKARYAELPTITLIGMNALAPVASRGRLTPIIRSGKFKGFTTGEYQVLGPDERKRAMWGRVGGTACPMKDLAEVLRMDTTALRRSMGSASLYIVHSLEIDHAGEVGAGVAAFDVALRQLRSAWRQLREAGVNRFVFTSDHGFLLLDKTIQRTQPHGRKIDPARRHVLSGPVADETGKVQVALTELGYEADDKDLHLVFSDSTKVFDVGNRLTDFVHGGNSLQERLIPVLTVEHRAQAGSDTLEYTLDGEADDSFSGMHCFHATLEVQSQGALSFGGAQAVELGVQVPDGEDVQVELCQVRSGGTLERGAIMATPGEEFEVFFKLTGAEESRVRVSVVATGGAQVVPLILERRFAVTATRPPAARADDEEGAKAAAPAPAPAVASDEWLTALPEGRVRAFFQHLDTHGTITEQEAVALLGGSRGVRSLSRKLDAYLKLTPFQVRIETAGGLRCYIRE